MFKRCRCPREEDEACDADSACWVEEPDAVEFGTDDGHYKTEAIDYDVVSVVDHEYSCYWVSPQEEAVDEETAFGEYCGCG